MQQTTKGMRIHIGIFGKRNVGKSSILNALTKQEISIVSETAGTTTDPVEKSMELLPLGPVLFVDTAGIDDEGALGKQRVEKTKKIIDRTDLAVIATDNGGFDKFEEALIEEFKLRKIPFFIVVNKIDESKIAEEKMSGLKRYNVDIVYTSALKNEGIDNLKQTIIKNVPEAFFSETTILSDLINPKETAILVVPIDFEAPKGRIILPQVQTIRDLLDNSSIAIVAKETELKHVLENLKTPPKIVITDSQAFAQVSTDVPEEILLTSFSILFARFKGELNEFVKGTMAIEDLKDGDKILICESCTHHPVEDDIGRVKIPNWLRKYTQKELVFEHFSGHDFPAEIDNYALIIHCGACMTNRREILSRILKAKEANIPITNYGLTIAYSLGIFERALKPFSEANKIYNESKQLSQESCKS